MCHNGIHICASATEVAGCAMHFMFSCWVVSSILKHGCLRLSTRDESHMHPLSKNSRSASALATADTHDDGQDIACDDCAQDTLDQVITLGDIKDRLRAFMTQLDNAPIEPAVMLHMATALPSIEGNQDGADAARRSMSLEASTAQSPDTAAYVAGRCFGLAQGICKSSLVLPPCCT